MEGGGEDIDEVGVCFLTVVEVTVVVSLVTVKLSELNSVQYKINKRIRALIK